MSEVVKTIGRVVGAISSVAAVILGPTPLGFAFAANAALMGQLTKSSTRPPPVAGSIMQVVHEVNAPAPYLMGEGLAAGMERWRCGYGPTVDDVPNPYLALQHDYCVGGPVESITPYIDQAAITGWYSGYLATNSQLGACPEAAALLPNGWGGYPAKNSTSKLSGKAAIMWNMRFDRDGKRFAAGLPNLAAYGKWVKVYDPRLDSTRPGGSGPHRLGDESTYTWSECPALHAGTYAYGRFQNGRKVMGVGLIDDAIAWDVVAAWANVCEANGWTIFGRITEPGDRWANLKEICLAGGAQPVLTAAGLSFLYWAPKVALDTITEADLADDDMAVTAMSAWRDRINAVIPKYRSPDHNWEMVAANEVQIPTLVTEDGGKRSAEWPFNLVKKVDQATSLGIYKVWDTRELQPIEISVGPRLRKYRPGECLWLDLPSLGLDIKAVIMTRRFDPARMVTRLTLMSETDAKHAYALGQTNTPPPTPAIGQTAEDRDKTNANTTAPSGYTRTLIANSGTVPSSGIMTAVDAGASAKITIAEHERVYADKAVTVHGGEITGLGFSTRYYVYYEDPLREGGTVSFAATTDEELAYNSLTHPVRHLVGWIDTPADGGSGTSGGGTIPFDASIARTLTIAQGQIDAIQDAADAATATADAAAAAVAAEVTRATGAEGTLSTQIYSLNTSVSGLSSSLSSEAIARADGDTALAASISSLTSTVNGNTASITSQSATLATLTSSTATIQQQLSAGKPNLLKNGSGELGFAYWGGVTGTWGVEVNAWGPFFSCHPNASGGYFADSDPIPVWGDNPYTCAANSDMGQFGGWTDGYTRLELCWFANLTDAQNNTNRIRLDQGPNVNRPWFGDPNNRAASKMSVTAPSTAGYVRVRIVGYATNMQYVAFGAVKFEHGSIATPYSQEASLNQTYITQQTDKASLASSITTLTADYGTLWSTVTVQASAIAGLESRMGAYWGVTAVSGDNRASITLFATETYSGFDIIGDVRISGSLLVTRSVTAQVIAANGITEVLQAYNGSSYSGTAVVDTGTTDPFTGDPIYAPDYWDVITITVNMDYAGDIVALVSGKQWYYSGGRDWAAEITIDGTRVFYTEGGNGAIADSISLSGKLGVSDGSHTVKFRWRSADSTLAMLAGKASLVTIRRYV